METHDNDSPDVFMTEEEIITDLLLYKMSEEDKRQLRQLPESELAALHEDVKQVIQKHYRLWDANNPYSIPGNPYHVNYPDKITCRAIGRVWSCLTGKPLTVFTITTQSLNDNQLIYYC